MASEVYRFDSIKEMYAGDKDFWQVIKYFKCPVWDNGNLYTEYFMQDGFYFKDQQLCKPDYAMRVNIIKELYSGGLLTPRTVTHVSWE